jgi:hypothetical protein
MNGKMHGTGTVPLSTIRILLCDLILCRFQDRRTSRRLNVENVEPVESGFRVLEGETKSYLMMYSQLMSLSAFGILRLSFGIIFC